MVFNLLDKRAGAEHELSALLRPVRDRVRELVVAHGRPRGGWWDGLFGRGRSFELVVEGMRGVDEQSVETRVKFLLEADADGSFNPFASVLFVGVQSGGIEILYGLYPDLSMSYSSTEGRQRGPETCAELDDQFFGWVQEQLAKGQ